MIIPNHFKFKIRSSRSNPVIYEVKKLNKKRSYLITWISSGKGFEVEYDESMMQQELSRGYFIITANLDNINKRR